MSMGMEIGTGFLGGATSGAAMGSLGGPIGTIIGGVVGGVVGAVGGIFTGKKNKKAKKYAKKANEIQQQREENANEAQYLALIREARINRAASVAEGSALGLQTSSLMSNAVSSIGSQTSYTQNYLAEDTRLFKLYSEYTKKAGKYATQAANTQSMWGALASLGSAAAVLYSQDDQLDKLKGPQGSLFTTKNPFG